jgi:hypothetical protein
VAEHRDEPPGGDYQLAWPYLLPEARLRRWAETIEIVDPGRARQTITIDFALPAGASGDREWMCPLAFLGKDPVAPDLEVKDASGCGVSIPTKRQNMALTAQAIDQLASVGAIRLGAAPELRDLVSEVISNDPVEARVARLVVEDLLDPFAGDPLRPDQHLLWLLALLEDQFLLWVPAHGEPESNHQVEITRRKHLHRHPMFPRRRRRERRTFPTAVGEVEVMLEARTGRRGFDLSAAAQRLVHLFGLEPLTYTHKVTEAWRFASYHLRVLAPDGLTVRELGLRGLAPTARPWHQEAETIAVEEEPGITHQGHESELAHLHCAKVENPPMLLVLSALGIRSGLTTLWAGAAVLTALLLWAVHRQSPDPDAIGGGTDITAAILLLAPTFAAAWAIRADKGDVLEKMLVGARGLLLASALLAVAAALNLAGLRPFQWDFREAAEFYASMSFGAAAIIVCGWLVTLRPTWLLYRKVLTAPAPNLALVAGAALGAFAVAAHDGFSERAIGVGLLGLGLALAAVAANPGQLTAERRGPYPVLAGVSAALTLLAAGSYLGFYDDLVAEHARHVAVLVAEALVFAAATVAWIRSP